MSKAFVRESEASEVPDPPAHVSPLPPGVKNLLTPAGAERLRAELARLVDTERPPLAAATPDDVDSRQQLLVVEERIRYLRQSLLNAEVVPPPTGEPDLVRFGATVIVRDNGTESRYRIVGVDEADIDRGWISWFSPIARALMNARPGQRITFKAPSGPKELEVVSIAYEP